MTENEVAKIVIDTAFQIHKNLGPELLESVYEVILDHELKKRGLSCRRQVSVPIQYNNILFDEAFRIDLLVNEIVIIEIKSIKALEPVHKKQLLTYLKLKNCRLGLLLNFGEELIKNGMVRIVNQLNEN